MMDIDWEPPSGSLVDQALEMDYWHWYDETFLADWPSVPWAAWEIEVGCRVSAEARKQRR